MKQTPGKIYLADQRGQLSTHQFQRYSTFNFGTFYQEHKTPLGDLCVVNEELVARGHHVDLPVDHSAYVLIIPLTGAVRVGTLLNSDVMVEAGEVLVISAAANSTIEVQNLFPADTIQFLHLQIQAQEPLLAPSVQRIAFNLNEFNNPLVKIISANKAEATYPFSLNLGRFAGRQEVIYLLPDQMSLFFAFVIAGAFEVEGRLLHEKDGLALWNTTEVELEALSNNALLLVLELDSRKLHS
ncbi:hypothetical protein HUW51_04960 [Adhaeribacter swui]|uniref:Quercetin 2,3-dioxygenase C-terminal cupin domain-containing protein n=1 Tax=Adhaeribacter swui TaxID=2086471 RepID=A0A7G7G4M5_9BACT|nr:hypothetical protein [Adhaeribacter swui]QNF32109.1 hypothetical protein HUW51_04960 [Adhaeribacter swui]